MAKCFKCKRKIAPGRETYMKAKIFCQKCWKIAHTRIPRHWKGLSLQQGLLKNIS